MDAISLKLEANVVDVWLVSLELNDAKRKEFLASLSAEECERASRLRNAQIQGRFMAARGWLRAILAGYLDVSPRAVRFGYTRYGKPYLMSKGEANRLRFNLSTSGELGLIGVIDRREIGVDLQEMLPDVDHLTIARQFFSANELQTLASLPVEVQCEAFYLCWTRKEAVIKASGEGFARSLADFDVSLLPGQPAALLNTRPDPVEAERWQLVDVEAGLRYKAALAVEGDDFGVRYRLT